MRTILFFKPYEVMSQFSAAGEKKTLAHFFPSLPKNIYPAGRLDFDSEGLIVLTSDKALAHRLTEPKHGHPRTYFVQVEGAVTTEAIQKLQSGVDIRIDGTTYRTRPATAAILDPEPTLPERNPPIRFRASIPTSWIALTLTEGKNRQVRRMTAAVGCPTLRLVRAAIGNVEIAAMQPGDWIELNTRQVRDLLG